MAIPALPASGSTDWYAWASGIDTAGRVVNSRLDTARGVTIPPHSLDIWRAALANHATDRPEVVILSDSTWWGQTSNGDAGYNVANYSPVAKLRELAAAAGITDGGPGIVGLFDSAPQLNIPVRPVDAGYTAPQSGNAQSLLNQYSPRLTVATTVTYRTSTTQARVWAWGAGDSGSFTYKVNGGAAVTVTPGTNSKWSSTLITGMTAGVDNTIQFTNVSGENRIDVEFLNATGVVFHKNAVPGATYSNFITSVEETDNNNLLQAILGADQTVMASAAGEGAHPANRKVRLAIWLLGINDLGQIAGQTAPRNADVYLRAADLFAQTARNGGADPVICIPHWRVNYTGSAPKAAGLVSRGLAEVAAANNCVLVDLNEALGGSLGKWSTSYYSPQNPHLLTAGYAQLGTWLFNNVLTFGAAFTPVAADTTAPTAPASLAAGTPTATTVPLTWTASTDAVGVTGYNAYNNGLLLDSTLTGTSGTLTGLTPSTTYVLTLKARDAAGNLSAASNTVTVTTPAAPADALLTEAGDILTTESGDTLVLA